MVTLAVMGCLTSILLSCYWSRFSVEPAVRCPLFFNPGLIALTRYVTGLGGCVLLVVSVNWMTAIVVGFCLWALNGLYFALSYNRAYRQIYEEYLDIMLDRVPPAWIETFEEAERQRYLEMWQKRRKPRSCPPDYPSVEAYCSALAHAQIYLNVETGGRAAWCAAMFLSPPRLREYSVKCSREYSTNGDTLQYPASTPAPSPPHPASPGALIPFDLQEEVCVGNARTRKYHHPACKWTQRIDPANRVEFKSRNEAIQQGYKPCEVCRP